MFVINFGFFFFKLRILLLMGKNFVKLLFQTDSSEQVLKLFILNLMKVEGEGDKFDLNNRYNKTDQPGNI